MKCALITGITGQDGAYLADSLLRKNYRVVGTYRSSNPLNRWRLQELGIIDHPDFSLVEHDLTDLSSSLRLIEGQQPDEIYNLAAQSYVGLSFEQPLATGLVNGIGAVNLLEAIRTINKDVRFYQASTSEMLGRAGLAAQGEEAPFSPHSPYGASKLYAHMMTRIYSEAYAIFAASGILFNHESPLRTKNFLSRKITDAVARIKLGKLDVLELGNMDVSRDWGYAKEYVEGMWSMLQAEKPDTYVLATGRSVTVREFADLAFKVVGIDLVWEGEGLQEMAVDSVSGKPLIRVNPDFFRPVEADRQVGDPSKAERELGWKASMPLEGLCELMVSADLRRNSN